MEMEWKIFFLQLILELGGLTGITIIGLKIFGNTFLEIILKKYEYKSNQKLELYKASIENKSYVSKTKFDATLKILSELSEKVVLCFDLVKEITPENGTDLDNSIDSKYYRNAIEEYKKVLSRNMPFIPEDLFAQLQNIYVIFFQQVLNYERLIMEGYDEIDYLFRDELSREEKNICLLLRQYYGKQEVSSE